MLSRGAFIAPGVTLARERSLSVIIDELMMDRVRSKEGIHETDGVRSKLTGVEDPSIRTINSSVYVLCKNELPDVNIPAHHQHRRKTDYNIPTAPDRSYPSKYVFQIVGNVVGRKLHEIAL